MSKKLLAFAAVLLAGTVPASAVSIGVNDIGATGTTTIQGIVDPGPVVVPGLTGTLGLTYTGVDNGGLTWNFMYTVTNTSSNPTTQSRISSFGFGTTPNIALNGAASTGLFDHVEAPTSGFPNVGGAMSIIEMCFSAGNNSCSGGGGLLSGQSASGTFDLTFSSVLTSIVLDAALFRFQSIASPGFADSGVGINTDVNINPVAVVPLPAALPMFMAGLVGIGLLKGAAKRFTRKRATA